ncbi:SRPBCC family protein [Microvirga lotononidis]|uniref:Activator of Hsp90 ATPase homologue 1/2-like C-terminal domain-containing protein n=1 Tax=Microvirga lotononidis TaxID=864069 RepID=I4Z242_9HYPH|nr:SRPBCC domain-containing protein [Microvirga lotononidis]EIM30284.1 hypothetical protein MicloDRAFT_00010890 [Microvirga lotononidis]WQO31123.1 SRPBCC domain-containing protein [Microvirga lotononidis]
MTQTYEIGANTLRFERFYDASIEEVWSLWTTKDGLEEWFAPEGMHVEVLALEPTVGGAFDHVMTAVGADQIAYFAKLCRPIRTQVSGRFVEVLPHRWLRIRLDIDFVPDVEAYPYYIAVEFHGEGERVRMIVTADRHPDAEMTQGAIIGLTSQLLHFDRAVAKRAGMGRRA